MLPCYIHIPFGSMERLICSNNDQQICKTEKQSQRGHFRGEELRCHCSDILAQFRTNWDPTRVVQWSRKPDKENSTPSATSTSKGLGNQGESTTTNPRPKSS